MVKNTTKLYRRLFLRKTNTKKQGKPVENILHIRGYDVTYAEFKTFITSRNLTKTPQNFVQGSFSIKLTIIFHKKRVEGLASGPLLKKLI